MKKLLTLLMALVMVFALATPAMAWVGWDAPETADPEDEVWNEFDLSGVKLEFFASSSATFSWVRSYYAEYNPANKGIVEGNQLRAVYALTLPPYSEVSANVKGQIDTMKLALTPSNMKMEKVEVYKSIGNGDRVSVATTTVPSTNKYSFAMNANSFQKDDEVTYEFMVTGYTLATKDVTLTAKLSIGQSAFNTSNEYTFTTASGRSYKVVHKGNYFYITNTNLTNNTAGTVRFTVDANGKVTDIAVSLNDGKIEQRLIKALTTAEYNNYVALNTANAKANAKAITEYQKDYLRQHGFTNWLAALDTTADDYLDTIQAKYNSVVALYPDKINANYKEPFDEDVVEALELEELIEFVTYKDYTVHKDVNGKVDQVKLSDLKYGIDLDKSIRYYEDAFYTASTNADMAKTIFSLLTYTIDYGYWTVDELVNHNFDAQLGENFWNSYKKAVEADVVEVTSSEAVATAEANGKKPNPTPDPKVYVQAVNYYKAPSIDSQRDTIGPNDSEYKYYSAIYTEILKVLGFEWDSTTKYMYEDKFAELFGANLSTSCPLVWKAYTAALVVPDDTDPPQTGDSASIVGFVMIALAVLAAGAVVIKKVRA